MASLARSTLLPQCTACTRRFTRQGLGEAWAPVQQQVRSISKAAKEEERNVVVKLLQDKPRWGRAGTLVTLNRSRMRNRWFPQRLADYVPVAQLKQLKAEGVPIGRDTEFGVVRHLQEDAEVDSELEAQRKHYVRPVEINFLTPERSMELLTTFIPATIDFAREAIEQDKVPEKQRRRYGSSDAADILTAAAMSNKPKSSDKAIYGSVSTTDVVTTIKSALAHNEEAARVVLSDNDVRFVEGEYDGDATRVKQLGTFKVEIQVPGAEAPITRTVRVRPRKVQEE